MIVLGEDLLPIEGLGLLMCSDDGKRAKELCGVFYQSINPTQEEAAGGLITSQRSLLLGVRISRCESWRHVGDTSNAVHTPCQIWFYKHTPFTH
jgi:hypothetical protein